MTPEPSEPARDCHNCNIVGCPGCNKDLRRQLGEVLRRWGLLDEVNNPKDAEEFAVTDLLSVVSAETERLRERHRASLRHADKVNNELMEEVQRYAIGKERPVLWSVYNRMHSRASHAEAALNRVGRIARRLAAHAAGFKDVLDASDCGPWGRTVGADIAELIEVLADQPAVFPGGAGEEPDGGTQATQCTGSVFRQGHGPHGWEPQPGMTPVRCPGFCSCKHPTDEHSVYGCADGCGCEYMPIRKPAGGAQQPSEVDGGRIVAYRSALPGALSVYCTNHTDELGGGVVPLTSDDLPNGGVCAGCGADVLIPREASRG